MGKIINVYSGNEKIGDVRTNRASQQKKLCGLLVMM